MLSNSVTSSAFTGPLCPDVSTGCMSQVSELSRFVESRHTLKIDMLPLIGFLPCSEDYGQGSQIRP